MRAIVLRRNSQAHEFMERVVALKPEFASAARPLLTPGKDLESRAVRFLLQRGLQPWVPAATDAVFNIRITSDTGSGQWCFQRENLSADDGIEFLTAAQKAEAAAENAQLQASAPSGADYLATRTLEWAKNHPTDPGVPEALHLVVQATRRGCTSATTGKYSKEAFDILHRRYPKSPWTVRTRYWYGNR